MATLCSMKLIARLLEAYLTLTTRLSTSANVTGSIQPAKHRYDLVCKRGKEGRDKPEEYIRSRIAEYGFDLWKESVAKNHTDKHCRCEDSRMRPWNSFKMTAMPSFGAIGVPDQEIWSIVAFLKKLPTVSEEDFKTWSASETQH
jgi:hypothetical protein